MGILRPHILGMERSHPYEMSVARCYRRYRRPMRLCLWPKWQSEPGGGWRVYTAYMAELFFPNGAIAEHFVVLAFLAGRCLGIIKRVVIATPSKCVSLSRTFV